MGEQKKTWVVLIQKKPRGPLQEAEIRALIEQQIVRRNDLAYEVGSSSQAQWKFLWQYPEFDARIGEVRPPPAVLEKRKESPPAQNERLEQVIAEEVPADLLAIRPEDLVLSSKPIASPLATSKDDEPQVRNQSAMSLPVWATPIFGLLVLISVAVWWFDGSADRQLATTPNATQKENVKMSLPVGRAPTQDAAPTQRAAAPVTRSVTSGGSVRPQVTGPARNAAMPPVERDKGEVSYEEFRRKRDEQLNRERKEEERRYQADADDKESPTEEEDAKPKHRKKNAKAAEAEEEDESVTRDAASEDPSESPEED